MVRRSQRIAAILAGQKTNYAQQPASTVRRSPRIAAMLARQKANKAQQAARAEEPSKQTTKPKEKRKPKRPTRSNLPADSDQPVSAGRKRKRAVSEDSEARKVRKTGASSKVPVAADPQSPTAVSGDLTQDQREFLEALHHIILVRRELREHRAASRKYSDELRELDELLGFSREGLADVPVGDEHQVVRNEIIADIRRFERHIDHREELQDELKWQLEPIQEELNDMKNRLRGFSIEIPLPCLKENAAFCETFERCHSLETALMDIELEMVDVEQDQSSSRDTYHQWGHQRLARVLRRAGKLSAQEAEAFVDNTKISKADVIREMSRLARRRNELKQHLRNIRVEFKWHNEILAQRAEPAMVDAGILEPTDFEDYDPQPEPEYSEYSPGRTMVDESPRAPSSDGLTIMDGGSHHSERGEPPSAKKRRILDEMIKAQFELVDARNEHNEGARMLTEDEIAALPQPVSEQRLAVALVQKLSRLAGAWIKAEENYWSVRQMAWEEGVADRFPIDQTSNFQDRENDGYDDSQYARRKTKAVPRVDKWHANLPGPSAGGFSSHVSIPHMSMPSLDSLRLGEDYMEELPSSKWRNRIDENRRLCDELRENGPFPKAQKDRTRLSGEASDF